MMQPGEAWCTQERRRSPKCCSEKGWRAPSVARLSDTVLGVPRSFAEIGPKPKRDVLRLHRLLHRVHQILAQGVQVCLIPELGRESLKGLCRIVLPAVEAAINEG